MPVHNLCHCGNPAPTHCTCAQLDDCGYIPYLQQIETLSRRDDAWRADLAAAQARADGLLLVVAEMRAALKMLCLHVDDDPGLSPMGMAATIVEGLRPLLAADPEARGHELLAAAKRSES